MALTQAERTSRTNLKQTLRAAATLLGGEVLDVAGVIEIEHGKLVIVLHDGTRITAKREGLSI